MPTANEYKRLRAKCESIRWSTGNKDVRKVSMDIGHIPSTRGKKKGLFALTTLSTGRTPTTHSLDCFRSL